MDDGADLFTFTDADACTADACDPVTGDVDAVFAALVLAVVARERTGMRRCGALAARRRAACARKPSS